ncbi:MAG: ABC transporter permease [Pirellulaceae bacterium]|nr:MAG: ABC transporter permease [Pirellulaceae bacterium]
MRTMNNLAIHPPQNEPSRIARRGPAYLRLLWLFACHSLIRDMSFRVNFLIECVSSVSWALMNIGFYWIVFRHTRMIGQDTGWGEAEFFVFLATTWFINSLVQTFFMPNAEEFSELIRTGNLDFVLLKPVDTQFLVSFRRMDWSSLSNMLTAGGLMAISLWRLVTRPDNPLKIEPIIVVLYIFYVLCGVAILYSVMIGLASTSIWLGRNQSLYDFWFYITNFSRYPMEIYYRGWGKVLWVAFTFVIPVLVVVNVPARLLARPLSPRAWWEWPLAGFAVVATLASLIVSRWVFQRALRSYRSASS